MDVAPPTPSPDVRLPRAGCTLLGIPVVAVALVFLAYGFLFWKGLSGRPATGDHVDIRFTGCHEAGPLIVARASQMGLPTPTLETYDGGFKLAAQLPANPEVAANIPMTLATRGAFAVHAEDGTPLLGDDGVASASVRLDLTMTPATLVVLTPAATTTLRDHMQGDPGGSMTILIDEVAVASWRNQRSLGAGELEIHPDGANEEARMHIAAARGIVLSHGPLPCPVQLEQVIPVEPSGTR